MEDIPNGSNAVPGILLVLDQKNYDDTMPVDERFCVRAVIIRDGKLAVQKSRFGEYKILGGGMEKGEDAAVALKREAEEESGLVICEDSIRLLGEILEKRRDLFNPSRVYMNHTLFFFCRVREEMTETNMTASELARGYHMVWAAPEEIISGNQEFLHMPWILRDTRFVEILCKEFKELL